MTWKSLLFIFFLWALFIVGGMYVVQDRVTEQEPDWEAEEAYQSLLERGYNADDPWTNGAIHPDD